MKGCKRGAELLVEEKQHKKKDSSSSKEDSYELPTRKRLKKEKNPQLNDKTKEAKSPDLSFQ